ncbi:MAG TPA: toprim domain-containing protein, partial [Planctomycetota bacterium]|nr:toprim domain-containing protein [Planctomycetota bacterium]
MAKKRVSKRGTEAAPRGKPVVIVESPAKAKTINKILGAGYVVRACMGHVRDLPERAFGVDPDHDFEATYQVLKGKTRVL